MMSHPRSTLAGAELDPAVFATVERDLATVRSGDDHRDLDERKARFLADDPPGCPPGDDLDEPKPAEVRVRRSPRFAARRGNRLGRPSNGLSFDDSSD
jgi:hypothetical protein